MTLNIDYQQLSADDKVELKGKIREILAKSASVDQAAVSVTLTQGSVAIVDPLPWRSRTGLSGLSDERPNA